MGCLPGVLEMAGIVQAPPWRIRNRGVKKKQAGAAALQNQANLGRGQFTARPAK